MSSDQVLLGKAVSTQAYTVYAKLVHDFSPFIWGGEATRRGSLTRNQGTFSVSTVQNARQGIKVDKMLKGAPGTHDFDLMMKVFRNRHEWQNFLQCFHYIDHRLHCDGTDRDDAMMWEEIERVAFAHATNPSTPEGSWEGEADAIRTIPFQGAYTVDIFRPNAGFEAGVATGAVRFTDASSGRPSSCYGCGIITPSGNFVAVTTTDTNPRLLVNRYGGLTSSWVQYSVTQWTNDIDKVLAIGDMIIMIATAETIPVIRSDNFGASLMTVPSSEWAIQSPTCLDGVNQSSIILGGQAGYVWRSADGGRSITRVNTGSAATTTQDLIDIKYSLFDDNVIWAGAAANVLIRSVNGGDSWAPISAAAASAGNDVLAVYALNENIMLYFSEDGSIYQTTDGGFTWVEQNALPDAIAAPTNAKIVNAGPGVVYLVVEDTVADESRQYANVDQGASGKWYRVAENNAAAIRSLAAINPNRVLFVGGDPGATPPTTNTNYLGLFAA